LEDDMTQATAISPSVITDAPIHPSLAVSDLARSRAWYADKLGWEPTIEPPGALVYELAPDAAFTLYETPFAGTAENTVMNWSVADTKAEVARLRGRGVTFEDYDFAAVKTVDGVMTDPEGGQNAWFKDPDGNIIAVLSAPPGRPEAADAPVISAMLAASDLGRATAWYRDKLGFEPIFEFEGVLAGYRSGKTAFSVYQTQFAGTAKNTVAVWRMRGIRDEVARLRGRGVVFEDYDFGDDGKTVDGILSEGGADINAWFTDSEGNILALAEAAD
jgi:catechol 2,3-dioxygenase-like lactoylglutathione lyase family enzyme